jgi:molybdopterin/thiamine biosynthesis adenylyltransferase
MKGKKMSTNRNTGFSILGDFVSIRFPREAYEAIRREFAKDKRNEQFAFGLFSQAKTADGTVLVVRDLFFPDEKDMTQQSGGRAVPTYEFQAVVYLIAEQRRRGILDIHTHTSGNAPHFSPIDYTESAKNAKYISGRFPYPVTHAMIVFNNEATAQDAIVYDRSLEFYRPIDSVEILGRRMEIIHPTEAVGSSLEADPRCSRQVIIPGWDQTSIGHVKVAVVGLGGNGARVLETFVSIGVGTEGWIAGIDPDVIEESNLPRIPYAFPEDVGRSKATVAAEFARHKNPKVNFYPYPCSVTEAVAVERIKAATIMICAPDNDGVRKVCNELSVRYMVPMIDLGCEIQVHDGEVSAGGQVRVVLPGSNACLVCCGGYDPSAAAIDLMGDDLRAEHAAHGYVQGQDGEPTPSVANLNAIIAQLGICAFLSLVYGEKFGNWDYAHFDQLTAQCDLAIYYAAKSP